jgi:hypothetical protein
MQNIIYLTENLVDNQGTSINSDSIPPLVIEKPLGAYETNSLACGSLELGTHVRTKQGRHHQGLILLSVLAHYE